MLRYTSVGLIFICPKNRITSLWDKLKQCAKEEGVDGITVNDYCMDYSGVRMSIISWHEILGELIYVATDRCVEMLGDLEQLKGFCDKIEKEAFVPFQPEDFGVQVARNIDRYYQVVDEVYNRLRLHKELNPSSKGLRKSPRWQGYTQYLKLGRIGLSIDYIRTLWKSPTSVETPFWCHFKEVNNQGNWVYSDLIKTFMDTIDSRYQEEFYGEQYVALIPKPYVSLEEVADDLCSQILGMYYSIVEKDSPV